MNAKTEVLDATELECLMAAVAIMYGSEQTADALILNFRAAKNSPAGVWSDMLLAADQADRDVQFANLQARAAIRADALAHARSCMGARSGWTEETLGHNIESEFGGELDADECDEIAREALGL